MGQARGRPEESPEDQKTGKSRGRGKPREGPGKARKTGRPENSQEGALASPGKARGKPTAMCALVACSLGCLKACYNVDNLCYDDVIM